MSVSLDVNHVPWQPEGPAPIYPAIYAGAIEAIAVDPNNAHNVYIGSVNGGIWHSDPSSLVPFGNWIPQTDQLPSLSIGALAFSPLNSSVLYAGLADTSHYANWGGTLSEGDILYTNNGGTSWSIVGEQTLNHDNVWRILPTTITSGLNQVVLAATSGGLYYSADSGNTWKPATNQQTTASMNQNTTDVVAGFNANAPNQTSYYAAVPNQGVFRSDDGGQTWTPVNSGLTGISGSRNIRLAVHDDSQGNHVVYAAIAGSNGQISGIFRTTNLGASWTSIGVPQIPINSSNPYDFLTPDSPFVADPADPNGVYISGYAASVYHGEFHSSSGSTIWTSVEGPNDSSGNGANGTGPHGDSRGMVIDPNGNLLLGDDGGFYQLADPPDPSARGWKSLNGNLQITEMVAVADDDLNQLIIGAAQDNGIFTEQGQGAVTYFGGEGGDGFDVAVDNSVTQAVLITNQVPSLPQPLSIHYKVYSSANGGFGTFSRDIYNEAGDHVTADNLPSGPLPLGGMSSSDLAQQGVVAVDAVNPNPSSPARLLFGAASQAYESDDGGETVFPLTTPDTSGVFAVTAGGFIGGAGNADAAFIGYKDGQIYVRTSSTSGFAQTQFALDTSKGQTILQIVPDPGDWHTVFVATSNRIWEGNNVGESGETWTDITGNLSGQVLTGPQTSNTFNVLSVLDFNGAPTVLAGAANGAYRTLNPGPNATWARFGANLPDVPVTDLVYDAKNNVLVAATLGRGAWEVPDASAAIAPANPNVAVVSDDNPNASAHTIVLKPDSNNSNLIDVFVDSTSTTPDLVIDPSVVPQIAAAGFTGGINTELFLGQIGSFTKETFNAHGFGNGSIQLDGLTIDLSSIAQVSDSTTAASFQFNDAQTPGALALVDGPGSSNSFTLLSLGSDELTNLVLSYKGTITIAANGDSTVGLDTTVVPVGLTQLTVDQPAGSTVNVAATSVSTSIKGSGSNDAVNVGNNHSTASIKAPLTVTNAGGKTALTIDASGDAQSSDDPSFSFVGLNANTSADTGSVANLAPASINFNPSALSSLAVDAFKGAGPYEVNNTGSGYTTTLNLSNDFNDVYIVGARGQLNVNGGTGGSFVDVGLGNTQSILAPIFLINPTPTGGAGNGLLIDDSSDLAGRYADLGPGLINGTLLGAGLFYGGANLNSLDIDGPTQASSLAGNAFYVNGTPPVPTTINSGGDPFNTATVNITATDPTHQLSVIMQSPDVNRVNVTTTKGNSYDVQITSDYPSTTTLNVVDPSKTAEITNNVTGTNAGTVFVRYFLGYVVIDGHFFPEYRTIVIPYQNVATVTTLPDAERSLILGAFHLALGRSPSLPELIKWNHVLDAQGINKTVKRIEHLPGALKPSHRAQIVVADLPDFQTVSAQLKQAKAQKHHGHHAWKPGAKRAERLATGAAARVSDPAWSRPVLNRLEGIGALEALPPSHRRQP